MSAKSTKKMYTCLHAEMLFPITGALTAFASMQTNVVQKTQMSASGYLNKIAETSRHVVYSTKPKRK